jgi:hypothetical protein
MTNEASECVERRALRVSWHSASFRGPHYQTNSRQGIDEGDLPQFMGMERKVMWQLRRCAPLALR